MYFFRFQTFGGHEVGHADKINGDYFCQLTLIFQNEF
jgi:hypothetical protein